MKKVVIFLGRQGLGFFIHFYRVCACLGAAVGQLRYVHFYRRQIIEQMYRIGLGSIPLVAGLSLFTGLATAIQTAYQIASYVPKYVVGSIVFQSEMLELAPTLMALVLAGRVGAGIASEIGTMKVSEQVDALESMGVDPIGYLVMPRIIAGVTMFPMIIIFAVVVAVAGGYYVAINLMAVSPPDFVRGMKEAFRFKDVWVGLIKATIYGGIITLLGSYLGMETEQGAKGVGMAATATVVSSSSFILVMDYILTRTLLKFY
ncbi:MAG: ABC transporter permease [candidate division KSB1 bacterium]|nr:ABC transporter permease [candidate division KSB1 bacterium]MDZ7304131.1 ABC transporter permease [candidate division KSB1 bacterium]MDZ7314086.1 ABC transporter permease [candidate division KSB1 bacterium]